MEKKAELTTQQIVILIILIISFIIILLFLLFLNPWNVSDKEVCHNSVVMRGAPVLPSEAISLDCKTRYLCITKDGSCEKMTSPDIEKIKTKEEVYKVLANEMADCWWMFGEGKVDYVGKDFAKKNLYCSICSQIAFDDSVEDIFSNKEIDQEDFYNNYLSKEKIENKDMTYSEYLFGVKDFSQIHSGSFASINIDKQQYVMMAIKSRLSSWTTAAVGAGGAAVLTTGLLLAPFTGGASLVTAVIIVGGAGLIGGTVGYFVGTAVLGESGNEFLAPTILEVNSDTFKAFNCSSINTLA